MKKSLAFVKARDASRRPVRGLYLRGKTFYARITQNDVRQWVKMDCETVEKAKIELATIQSNLKLGRPVGQPKPKTMTFSECSTVYMENIKALKKPKTVRNESKQLTGILIPYFGKYRIDMISRSQIEQFRVFRRNQKYRDDKKVSAHTVNHNIIVLRNVLKSAVMDGIIEENVAGKVKPLKVVVPAKRFVPLSEILAVADWIKAHVRRGQIISDAIKFLAFVGARFSEGMTVKWEDIDWSVKNVCVGASGDTKNSSARYVPFFIPELEPLLRGMYDRSMKRGWLFPSNRYPEDPNPPPLSDFTASLNRAIKKLGQPHWSPHDLRHHFGSRLAMAGVDFKSISDLLGHRDGGILAARTYSHLSPDHLKSQMAKLLPPPNVVAFKDETGVSEKCSTSAGG
jgi:integrase